MFDTLIKFSRNGLYLHNDVSCKRYDKWFSFFILIINIWEYYNEKEYIFKVCLKFMFMHMYIKVCLQNH